MDKRINALAQERLSELAGLVAKYSNVFGQRPVGRLTRGEELRVVLLDEPEEEGLLGLMSP